MTMSEHARPKNSVTILSTRVCSINDNSRQIVKRPRNMKSRIPMSSLTSTSSLRHRSSVRSLLVTSIIAALSLLGRANAGISFGGVTSTDACYSALESAAIPGQNKVDKNGYVSFINELSNDAFTSFRNDETSDEWGMFPIVEFEELPSSIKGVFYKIACGGEYTICEEAYLYTDGIQDDTNPQDVVYLFELCNGVEDAIAEEKVDDSIAGATNTPTQTPTLEASITEETDMNENSALLDPDNLIDDGKKKTNTIAIVASSCIALLLIGIVVGLFIYRGRNHRSDKSDVGDGRESYATPDFDTPNDLVGGEKNRDVSKVFPVAESGSDSSMESFSGSSSDDSSTSTSDSNADDDSQSSGSLKYRSSTSAYAAHGNSRASSRSSSRSSAKDRSRASSTPTDEDSSAGSSGWESSDGGSSVDSASVKSYKGDLTRLKSGSTSTTPIDGSIISSSNSSSQELGVANNPQENNHAMDRGVTMIRVEEESRKSVSSSSSSSSSSRSDVTPSAKAIEEAIEIGDWQAVGATAAMLASTTFILEQDNESDLGSGSKMNDNDYESTIDSSALSNSARTVDSDVARTAEIDKLVDAGNWDGVVAAAARYVEEAEEAEEELLQPYHGSSSNSLPTRIETAESDVDSASVESADSSTAYSNISRSDFNDSTHGTTVSGSEKSSSSGAKTLSDKSSSSDTGTISSPSRDWRRKAAYRAEVEALIRRVVPEELSNVDNILAQFEGRDKELIVTLKSMHEKSIAQRARATVQHTNRRRSSGRSSEDSNQSESIGEDYTEDDDDESSRGGTTNTHSTGVSDGRESGVSSGRSITSASGSSLSGSSLTNQTNTTSEVSSNNHYVRAASDRSHDVGRVEREDSNSVGAGSNGWSNIIATASNMERKPARGSSSDDID